ncbi:MAG TPA: citramalate synthase, partial [bacterium]|nr:citramalate synthase [bacterium]
MNRISIYDTTLRDGTQGSGINFSLQDKLRITETLEDLGIEYVEGGWPGSNPKDIHFFSEVRKKKRRIKISAFGSTRRKNIPAGKDENLRKLVAVRPDAFCIFGKTWLFHVEKALRTDPEENIRMISSSIRYLKKTGREVLYDAEHFFDGFKSEPGYAILTLKEALSAGASWLVLCDTNGGSLPFEIARIVKEVRKTFPGALIGIHAHNDSDNGVANSLEAIAEGARMVQGTINGYGERCGNANLCSVIPGIELKMGLQSIGKENLIKLTRISRKVDEIANLIPRSSQPYVGENAFAHKGGIHVSAVARDSRTYEHVAP